MLNSFNVRLSFLERRWSFGTRPVGNISVGFLALLFLFLPLLSFAQSDYYFTPYSTPYYAQYQCGDAGTTCGSNYVQNFSSSPQSYNLTQVAGVAAAFSPVSVAPVVNTAPPPVENPPQLPRTGGGGRVSEVQLKTGSFFIPITAVFFLSLPLFFFFKVVSKNDNCL